MHQPSEVANHKEVFIPPLSSPPPLREPYIQANYEMTMHNPYSHSDFQNIQSNMAVDMQLAYLSKSLLPFLL